MCVMDTISGHQEALSVGLGDPPLQVPLPECWEATVTLIIPGSHAQVVTL